MAKKFSFYKTRKIRSDLLKEAKGKDNVFFEGENEVLISVPHGVSQTRLGKHKVAEPGTIPLGFLIAEKTKSHIIIKTKNNFDDANFDMVCAYRRKMKKIIKEKNIKFLIDFHELARSRDCDLNFGTNLEMNIKKDISKFDRLYEILNKDFSIKNDTPFMATGHRISACMAKEFGIWCLQIEVNCVITNERINIERFNTLVDGISQWIEEISEREEYDK